MLFPPIGNLQVPRRLGALERGTLFHADPGRSALLQPRACYRLAEMAAAPPEQIRETIDTLYRTESGRVLATLVGLLGDLDLAEESMHEAFTAALESWT